VREELVDDEGGGGNSTEEVPGRVHQMFGLTTGSLVEPAGEDRGEGGCLVLECLPEATRGRGGGREREETLRKCEGKRRNSRRREEKCESDEVEDKGRPSSSF